MPHNMAIRTKSETEGACLRNPRPALATGLMLPPILPPRGLERVRGPPGACRSREPSAATVTDHGRREPTLVDVAHDRHDQRTAWRVRLAPRAAPWLLADRRCPSPWRTCRSS